MNVGDLVRWRNTNPKAIGIVIERLPGAYVYAHYDGTVRVLWSRTQKIQTIAVKKLKVIA